MTNTSTTGPKKTAGRLSKGADSKPRRSRGPSIPVITALIGAVATVVAALVTSPLVLNLWPMSSEVAMMAVRVADGSGGSIPGAKVSVFHAGGASEAYSDGNGAVNFTFAPPVKGDLSLIVESVQYETEVRNLQRPPSKLDIRLKERSAGLKSVIARVVDDATSEPVTGAKVLLLVGGNVFSEMTDSNGITKLNLPFPSATLDAELSVQGDNYTIAYQNVTLQPDTVQNVRLNPKVGIVAVTTARDQQGNPQASGISSVGEVIGTDQDITGSISAPGQEKVYLLTLKAADYFFDVSQLQNRIGNSDDDLIWELTDNSGKEIFRQTMQQGADGKRSIQHSGVYLLKIYGASNRGMNSYAFRVLTIPAT